MLSFKQFQFQPNQNFEPSKAIKDFWLYTKKNRSTFSGIQLPGLFETVDYSTQISAFLGILILEGIPTFYGVGEGVLWQGILAAIFIDIFLAIMSHNWHDRICLNENKLVVENNIVQQVALNREIASLKMKSRFFYLLIIISGIFKFYLFYDAYMTFNTITIAVFVCYMLGSILHITYTGYFYYTSRFNFKIQKEYTAYITTGGQTHSFNAALTQPILTDSTNLTVTNAGRHSITEAKNGQYDCNTFGILLDTELARLVGVQQGAIAQGIVARAGLSQQLQILNAGNLNQQPQIQNTGNLNQQPQVPNTGNLNQQPQIQNTGSLNQQPQIQNTGN